MISDSKASLPNIPFIFLIHVIIQTEYNLIANLSAWKELSHILPYSSLALCSTISSSEGPLQSSSINQHSFYPLPSPLLGFIFLHCINPCLKTWHVFIDECICFTSLQSGWNSSEKGHNCLIHICIHNNQNTDWYKIDIQ